MLSIVIPTITGREETLDRCLNSYTQYTPHFDDVDVVIIQDAPNWPAACNEGFRQSLGDVIHFTADDLEATEGWLPDALTMCLERNELPAPVVYNHSLDGEWDNRYDGADGAVTHFTRIPMMTRCQWEEIGEWPEIPYASDVWVSERGRQVGIETRMVYSYRFVHHWSQIGRIDSPENIRASDAWMEQWRRSQ